MLREVAQVVRKKERIKKLETTSQTISDRVAALVKQFPHLDSVGANDDLEERGLTSMDMVNLMMAVEAEFDVTIPPAKLQPANFRSIAKIEALVASLKS